MTRWFLGKSQKDKKILNAYLELRSKMEKAEKLLAELVENPQFDDAMAAGPEFKALREAAQARRGDVVKLELLMAERGLTDVGFKYVTTTFR